ncbi:MAG: class I SAM-dependent methyltransferase [Lachnospiraceae bacterium]|nr:class I SAM-dependent methyltransferase [Lachnospiraceae bacterium]
MSISKRLELIANLVTPGYRVSDIGTDHGYVPIYLLRQNLSPSAIAVDISKGSLDKAIFNVSRAGLEEKIDCRLSDGLDGISPGETDSIIIAGMGGILMDKILRRGIDVVLSSKELILAPHRDIQLMHQFAEEYGMEIVYDNTILDKKKYYNIVKLKVNNNCK